MAKTGREILDPDPHHRPASPSAAFDSSASERRKRKKTLKSISYREYLCLRPSMGKFHSTMTMDRRTTEINCHFRISLSSIIMRLIITMSEHVFKTTVLPKLPLVPVVASASVDRPFFRRWWVVGQGRRRCKL